MAICFRTSGWRAVIGDEFTFATVRRVTGAVCEHLRSTGVAHKDSPLIIAHDTRFLGEQFAKECGVAARAYGLQPILCDGPTPSPAIAQAIRALGAVGALTFTASDYPSEFSGMKFSTADGAPAPLDVYRRITAELIDRPAGRELAADAGGCAPATLEYHDPRPAYLADLATKVRFDLIARAGGRYAYDPLWGTGRGYLDRILRSHGIDVETIHDRRDVLFGGRAPVADKAGLDELREVMKERECLLGFVTDGGSDHFGVLDRDGTYISPNNLIALLFDYLAESRGWTGGAARSVITSHLVDRVAASRALPLYETPVGFNVIGELINQDKIILGGEESASLSIRGHYPERDGILACLLAAEAVAARGTTLSAQLEALYARVGRLEGGSIGVPLTPATLAALPGKLDRAPEQIGGRRVARTSRVDGVKYMFADGSWLLIRRSGTEPLVRIYAESESKEDLEVFLEQGRKYLLD